MSKLPADIIDRAKQADLLEVARRYVGGLKRVTVTEWAGPCPACRDGDDRFSVNIRNRFGTVASATKAAT